MAVPHSGAKLGQICRSACAIIHISFGELVCSCAGGRSGNDFAAFSRMHAFYPIAFEVQQNITSSNIMWNTYMYTVQVHIARSVRFGSDRSNGWMDGWMDGLFVSVCICACARFV